MPSGNAKELLKAKLLRMKPHVRALAVTKLRQYKSSLDPHNKRMLMKSGLSLNPETQRIEQDQDRAAAEMARHDPLVARQEESLAPPASEMKPPTD